MILGIPFVSSDCVGVAQGDGGEGGISRDEEIRTVPKSDKIITTKGTRVEHQFTLLFHFLGFGLLVTINIAGFILNSQYKKAQDFQTKAVILRSLRPIGLLSPIAILVMLITGIGNMHTLGLGILDVGWLTAKIIFFAIAAISGIIFGIVARKRGKLVQEIAAGKADAKATETLKGYDKQISLFYLVMPILLLVILWLSIYGRLGGQ